MVLQLIKIFIFVSAVRNFNLKEECAKYNSITLDE